MSTTQPEAVNYDRLLRIALIIGIVAAVIAVVGLFISGPGVFFQAYLYSFLFWLGISGGLLLFLVMYFLTRGRWILAFRPIAEAGGRSIWIMALLFIPLIVGLPFLYPWARPAEVASSAVLQYKSFYLNIPFFIIRAVIYFAAWILLGVYANRILSRDPNSIREGRHQTFGAFGMIIYSITMTYAAIDWIMSLQPEWVSSIFGVLTIIGQVTMGLAWAILMINLLPNLVRESHWNYREAPVPFKDLGAMLFVLINGWAYMSFFQLLIIWAGNKPNEVFWYVDRTNDGWAYVAAFIGLFEFFLPFIILLNIRIRHNLRALAGISAVLLFVYLVIMFWHVKPAFYPDQFTISWLDIVMPFAIGGLWLAAFFRALKRVPAYTPEDLVVLDVPANQESAVL